MIKEVENGGYVMSPDVFQRAKLNVYMEALQEVAADKIKGQYDKAKYDIRVAMVGRSLGIPTKVSRENLNATVKAFRRYKKTGDEKHLELEIKLK